MKKAYIVSLLIVLSIPLQAASRAEMERVAKEKAEIPLPPAIEEDEEGLEAPPPPPPLEREISRSETPPPPPAAEENEELAPPPPAPEEEGELPPPPAPEEEITKKVEHEKTDWFEAVRNSDLPTLQKLYAVNKSLLEARDAEGNTALLNTLDSSQSLLPKASVPERTEVFNWLLAQGANPSVVDNLGFTALMLAAESGFAQQVLQTLINRGVSVTAKTLHGRTALMSAAERNPDQSIIKFLLKLGGQATINDQTTQQGMTALMFAVQNLNKDNVLTLLRAGADETVKNKDGETARAMADKLGSFILAPFETFDAEKHSATSSPAQEKTTASTPASTKETASNAISPNENAEQAWNKYKQFLTNEKIFFPVASNYARLLSTIFPKLSLDTIEDILRRGSIAKYVLFLQGYVIGNDAGYDVIGAKKHTLTPEEDKRARAAIEAMRSDAGIMGVINSVEEWTKHFNTSININTM